MLNYKWNKNLEFGIKEIDEQHQHMMELVNDFSKMDTDSFSRDDVLDVFNDIISYAHVHFLAEEKIFKESAYPETEEHIKEHQKLLLKINNLFLSFSEKDITHTVKEVAELLKEWIEDHLMRVDKKYVSFLLGR